MEKLIKLAKSLDTQFKEDNFNVYNFHKLAAKALQKVSNEDVTIDKIIEYLNNGDFSRQFIVDDHFGEPSITLYQSNEIILDILVWTSSDTNIHTHGFTGAFRTMKGETIQAVYKTSGRYEAPYDEIIEDDIDLKEIKNLKIGSIQEIPSGVSFMHKSYHIETPTVNLLFRTCGNRESKLGLIQHSVLPPRIMYKNFMMSEIISKRLSLVNALIKVDDKRFKKLLESFVSGLSDSDLIGIKLHGAGNLHFTKRSKNIIFTAIFNEIKSRGLYDKFNKFKSENLVISRVDRKKTFDKFGCLIEALIDCRLTIEEMDKFLKDNNLCSERDLLVETIAHVNSTLNNTELLRLSFNQVALDIFQLMLRKKSNNEITNILTQEYDALPGVVSRDVERTSAEILKNPQIAFLFNKE